jgi:hypothetical protein
MSSKVSRKKRQAMPIERERERQGGQEACFDQGHPVPPARVLTVSEHGFFSLEVMQEGAGKARLEAEATQGIPYLPSPPLKLISPPHDAVVC